jgi:hypothetical protein
LLPKILIFAAQKNNFAAQSNKFAAHFTNSLFKIVSIDSSNFETFKMRLTCCKNECKRKFRIIAPGQLLFERKAVVFVVYQEKGDFAHDSNTLVTAPITGLRSIEISSMMKSMSAQEFVDLQHRQVSKKQKKNGNLVFAISSDAARKRRSRAIAEHDLDEDDLLDLQMKMEKQLNERSEAQRFIRDIFEDPFTVLLFNLNHFKIIYNLKREQGYLDVGLDATGSVCRKLNEESQIVLYYALTTRLPSSKHSGDLYQLGGMLSNKHFGRNISYLLDRYKFEFLQKCKKWDWVNFITDLTTDFSFPNIHAVLASFNNTNLISYLKRLYNMWLDPENADTNFVLLHLCYAHLVKTYAGDLEQFKFSNGAKKNFMRIFALICLSRSREEYLSILRCLILILIMPRKSNGYTKIIADLQIKSNFKNTDAFQKNIEDSEKFKYSEFILEETTSSSLSIYNNSKFYQEALQLKKNVSLEFAVDINCDNLDLQDNPHFNPSFLDVFLKKYISLAPLFVNIISSREVSITNFIIKCIYRLI